MKSDAGDRVSRRTRTRPTGLISTGPPSWFPITRSTAHEGGRAPTAAIAAIHNDHSAQPFAIGGSIVSHPELSPLFTRGRLMRVN